MALSVLSLLWTERISCDKMFATTSQMSFPRQMQKTFIFQGSRKPPQWFQEANQPGLQKVCLLSTCTFPDYVSEFTCMACKKNYFTGFRQPNPPQSKTDDVRWLRDSAPQARTRASTRESLSALCDWAAYCLFKVIIIWFISKFKRWLLVANMCTPLFLVRYLCDACCGR